MDAPIIAVEQFGVQLFALAVVIGKIITYTTLLCTHTTRPQR